MNLRKLEDNCLHPLNPQILLLLISLLSNSRLNNIKQLRVVKVNKSKLLTNPLPRLPLEDLMLEREDEIVIIYLIIK